MEGGTTMIKGGEKAETSNERFQNWWKELLPIRNSESHQNKALPKSEELELVQKVYDHYSKIIDFTKYEKIISRH